MKDGQGELSLEQVKEITDGWDVLSDPRPLVANRLWAEINELRLKLAVALGDCERERMRLAGCGVAALCDTPESSVKQRIGSDNPYWSASYGDVCRRTDECIRLRAEVERLKGIILAPERCAHMDRAAAAEAELEKARAWNDECAAKAENALDMAEQARSDIETLNARAWGAETMLRRYKMAAQMVCQEVASYTTYDENTGTHDAGEPKLFLHMNDVFAWATADGEPVEWDDVHKVFAIWKLDGWDGLLVWACKKRNARPQKPVFEKLKPEIQERLKDLPRFGDTTVPVGDGKYVTFDDGWRTEKKLAVLEKSTPSLLRRIGNAIRDAVSLDFGKI